MKIADLEVIRLRSPEHARPLKPAWTPGGTRTRSEATLVRVDTDEGITGWGAFNASDVAAVDGWLKPQLIGQDPFALEQHARLFRNAGGAWGVEIALWDLIGKATGQPIYKLWGGHKDRVPGYASCVEVRSGEQRAEDAAARRAEGWRAIKLRLHDWTIKGPHLCMTRLNLLRLNTAPAFDEALLADVSKLKGMSNEDLRELGRIPYPMLREKGDKGFRRISWDEALGGIAKRIQRMEDRKRLAFFHWQERMKSVRRRALREDGTLGPEQLVTSLDLGAASRAQPRRLPDGRLAMLMLTGGEQPRTGHLSLALVDGDAPLPSHGEESGSR